MSRLSRIFRANKATAKARRTRLSIDALEARDVPNASFSNGVLTVTGTSNSDQIELLSRDSDLTIVRVNDRTEFISQAQIAKINVDALGQTGPNSDVVIVKGVRSGISGGVNIDNAEFVLVGENRGSGVYSTDKVRSDVFVDGAESIMLLNNRSNDNRNVVVSSTEVTGMAPGRISFTSDLSNRLDMVTGKGNDTITVNGTPAGQTFISTGNGADVINIEGTTGRVEVNGGADVDRIQIAPTSRTMSSIVGFVNIKDGNSDDRVTIHDEDAGKGFTFLNYEANLVANRLSRTETIKSGKGTKDRSASVVFDRVRSLDYFGPSRPAAEQSTIVVESTRPTTKTSIDAGLASFVFGDVNHRLDGIKGVVNVTGETANAQLTFDDIGQTDSKVYRLKATTFQRNGVAPVTYSGFRGGVEVRAGSGADVFAVSEPRVNGRPVLLDGNAGADRIAGASSSNNAWQIAGQNQGILNSTVEFADVENLTGGIAADTFRFGVAGGLDGKIDGGTGFDTLDYHDFTTAVTVDLGKGAATNVTGGVTQILNVFGGSANDVLTGNTSNNLLLGNDGADQLNGGFGGRDVLIGGLGVDRLTTNSAADTIYIGGDLAIGDRNDVGSVRKIMNEWTGTNNYETRVTNFQTGGGALGGLTLNDQTLDGDAARDVITAKAGRDLFYIDGKDAFGNPKPAANEQIIRL